MSKYLGFLFIFFLGEESLTENRSERILENNKVAIEKFLELKESEKQLEILKGSYNNEFEKKLDKKYEKIIKEYSKKKEYNLKEKQKILELQRKEYEKILNELEKLDK